VCGLTIDRYGVSVRCHTVLVKSWTYVSHSVVLLVTQTSFCQHRNLLDWRTLLWFVFVEFYLAVMYCSSIINYWSSATHSAVSRCLMSIHPSVCPHTTVSCQNGSTDPFTWY